jgi:hypothetical protein
MKEGDRVEIVATSEHNGKTGVIVETIRNPGGRNDGWHVVEFSDGTMRVASPKFLALA